MESFDAMVNRFCAAMMRATVTLLRKRGVEPKDFDDAMTDTLIKIMRRECRAGIEVFLKDGKQASDACMTPLLTSIFAAEVAAAAIRAVEALERALPAGLGED